MRARRLSSTFAIGDVHGCSKTLRRLLDLLPLERATDRFWLVGDLVAQGPDSTGVLRMVRELELELGPRLVAVLGNHDLRLLAARTGVRVPRKVREVLDPILASEDGAALLDWLAERPLLHHDGQWALVHAGLLPSWRIDQARTRADEARSVLASTRRDALLSALYSYDEDAPAPPADLRRALETARVMTTVRTLRSDGTLCDHNGRPETAPPDCSAWFAHPNRAHRETTLVFGHWATLGLRLGETWIALDSGCAWGGPLSAVRLEDRAVFQTPRLD